MLLTSGSVKQFAGYPYAAIHIPNQHNHDVTEHARDNCRSQDQAFGHKRVILGSGRVGEPLVPGLPDRTIHFCWTWSKQYPDTRPGNNHYLALAYLTGSSSVQIQMLFERGFMFQSNPPPRNDPYSTLLSGSSALPVQSTGDDGSTLPTSIQDSSCSEVNMINGATEADPVPQAHLIAQSGQWQPNAPNTNVQADEAIDAKIQPEPESYRRALERAAREARDRRKQKCKRTNVPGHLERDPYKPFQCTQKCGQNFARKGDWERHEAIQFPQHGWVCMIGEVHYLEDNRFCAYCEQRDPTRDHVREKHRKYLRYCQGGEKPFCERVFFRREHFNQHFSQVHPTLNPEDYASKFNFEVASSAFPRCCGFCDYRFPDWKHRTNHIARHFHQEKKSMREWQDPSSEAEDEASADRDDDDNSDHDNYSEEETYCR